MQEKERYRAKPEMLEKRRQYCKLFINDYRNSEECDAIVDTSEIDWKLIKDRKTTLTVKELYKILYELSDSPLDEPLTIQSFKKFLKDEEYEWDTQGHFITSKDAYTLHLRKAFYYLLKDNPTTQVFRDVAKKENRPGSKTRPTLTSPLYVFFQENLYISAFSELLMKIFDGKIYGITSENHTLIIYAKKITFSDQIQDFILEIQNTCPKQ